MIRIETEADWLLLTHADHARLAGELARHWKNDHFAPPEPFAHVLDAVARHDDSWTERDARPLLTPENNPSAFSRELVGTYDAFEEIDLEDYLGVRAAATEAAATRDSYAAILISMHTVNLLTEQADLSTLQPAEREVHTAFIEGQRRRQAELRARLRETIDIAPFATDSHFQRGFEFLQACDSFSLYVGVAFPKVGKLRHPQVTRSGERIEIVLRPTGDQSYTLDPWPLDEPEVHFQVPYRRVPKSETASLDRFQNTYAKVSPELVPITIHRL